MGPRYAALASTIPVEPFSPPFHLAFHRFFLERLALIKELFPLGKSKIDFDLSVDKVELDRNQGVSPLLYFADEPFDLPFVKEEFPRPQRVVIQSVRLGIGADMSVDQEDLTPLDIPVAIPEADLSLSQGLDLRPKQADPGLVSLLNEVIVKCFSILANDLFAHLSTSQHRA